jgi:uncharacterized membrane protein
MSYIEKSIEINVPVKAAYNQWTQFEEFPRFMEGVKEVQQLDDKHLHWKAEIAGKEKEWNAEITEQIPDQRIAWTSVAGAWTGGTVTFHQLSDQTSKVLLRIEYEPQGFVENVGDAAGLVEGDLERSKSILNGAGKKRGTIKGH